MKDYNYADGLERIEIARGMVRMDFYQFEDEITSPYDSEESREHETTERLVMPAEAFLRAFKAMSKIVAQLEGAEQQTAHRPEPPRRFGSSRPYAPAPASPTGTGSHSGFIS